MPRLTIRIKILAPFLSLLALLTGVSGYSVLKMREMGADPDLFLPIVIATVLLVGGLIASLLILNSLFRSIQTLTEGTEKLAVGDLNYEVKVEEDDEIGDLAWNYNSLQANMKNIAEICKSIANGNLDQVISIRSEYDALGQAINHMIERMREVEEENRDRRWVNEGLIQLRNYLNTELEINMMCEEVIQYIGDYVSASMGAVYVMSVEGDLRLAATFAMRKDNLPEIVDQSEGLIGQVVTKQKYRIVSELPNAYFSVSSALGENRSQSIALFPLVHQSACLGVIELASITEFSLSQLNFLNEASGQIASAINSAESRHKIVHLLSETQEQSNEIATSEEELRITNDELHRQQAILETTNAEIESQRNRLLEQRQELQAKNVDLENAKLEIEKRAEDLEIVSRYKSEFLANMSHELRTPLNSLIILSQMLAENEHGNLTEDQIKYSETILGSGRDLLTLINDILDLAKVEAGKISLSIRDLPLEELKEQLYNNFAPISKKSRLNFVVEIDPDLPKSVRTDPLRLRQVIFNLLGNAFKFTSQGQINVEMKHDSEDLIAITVTDTGIGIPAEKHELIFGAFQQADGSTRRRYGGAGLGLSISREIARMLGGKVTLVRSEEKKGSTFQFTFPITYSESAVADQLSPEVTAIEMPTTILPETLPKSAQQEVPQGDERAPQLPDDYDAKSDLADDDRDQIKEDDRVLLIVEDDEHFAEYLKRMGQKRGFKCVIATRGDVGLAFSHKYKPDAIILDLMLPIMDGWDVLERLKRHPETRHIPVHIISGLDDRTRGLRLGAIDYQTKPVSVDALGTALDRVRRFSEQETRTLLIIEDNDELRDSIIELIGNGNVQSVGVATGGEALEILKTQPIDCIVLDLGLPDMPWSELLEQIRSTEQNANVPIIVYTGRELTEEQESELEKYAESIIIKDVKSPERLLEETALFLHRVEADLPEEKRQILRTLYNKDSAFVGKKIVVADDDMRNVFALTSSLRRFDMEISIAENGQECIDLLEENDDFDLVLMDIMMPEVDGYQAMRAIRKMPGYKSIPIIAVTAKAMKEDRDLCLEAGASDYISKPVDMDRLISLMRVWLYKQWSDQNVRN